MQFPIKPLNYNNIVHLDQVFEISRARIRKNSDFILFTSNLQQQLQHFGRIQFHQTIGKFILWGGGINEYWHGNQRQKNRVYDFLGFDQSSIIDGNQLIVNNPMKQFSILALLIVLAFTTVVPHVGPVQTHVPLIYRVKLDDPPSVRWAPIIRDYQQVLTRMIQLFDLLPIPHGFYDGIEWYAKNEFIHQDFVREVDAIAKLSGLPFDKLFFLNFMYQFSTFKACSSILVRNSEGIVVHGRNMDFQMWELVSKMQVTVEYQRQGKLLFSIDSIVGMAFALTGIRHNAFAITEDTRFTRHFTQDLISIIKNNAIPSAWLIRRVLAEESTYESAVQRLKTQEIGGPIYYIVSGIKKGIVIERQTKGVHAAYELDDNNWFLVQTNYDRDGPEPIWDVRRSPVEQKLRKRGNSNFDKKSMFQEIVSQWPTFNIASIISVVMVPEINYHNITVWYGQNPSNSVELA